MEDHLGGGIGENDSAGGDIIRFMTRNDHHRIRNSAQHFLKTWTFRLDLDLLFRSFQRLDFFFRIAEQKQILDHSIANHQQRHENQQRMQRWEKGHSNQDRAPDDGAERNKLPDALTLFHIWPVLRGIRTMTTKNAVFIAI